MKLCCYNSSEYLVQFLFSRNKTIMSLSILNYIVAVSLARK